jgi:hypothetical protein
MLQIGSSSPVGIHYNSLVPTFAPAQWMRLLLKWLGPGGITGAAADAALGIANSYDRHHPHLTIASSSPTMTFEAILD